MRIWSMREAYEELGVSRTTLQGWVDDILKTPTGINENGWYFDEADLERLWRIRIYKQLKYKNIEIYNALFKEQHFGEDSLQHQIDMLTQQKEELEQLINIASIMKETGLTPSAIRFSMVSMEDAPFAVISLLMSSFNDFSDVDASEIVGYTDLFEGEGEVLLEDALDTINHLKEQGERPVAKTVQEQVSRLYDHFAATCCPSIVQFTSIFASFYQETEGGNYIDQEFGKGYASFLSAAVKQFAQDNEDNPLDNIITDALDAISSLGRKKFTTGSAEVQEQVKRIHDCLCRFGIISPSLQLQKLRQFSTIFGSDAVRKELDGGAKRGLAWFMSRAFEIYCNNLEQVETLENSQF